MERPREEPTNVRSIKITDRVWKLVNKASKGYRSINEYLLSIIENDLIKEENAKEVRQKKNFPLKPLHKELIMASPRKRRGTRMVCKVQ